jgi:hypothetical protein
VLCSVCRQKDLNMLNDEHILARLSAPPTDLLTQLVTGPSLREVGSTVLRSALAELYPALELDPDLVMVGTPSWITENQRIIAGDIQFESLTDALLWHVIADKPVMYLDGEHFLTRQPTANPSIQLPVNIDAIGRQLNTLSTMLFTAYQEQQLDYWNEHTSVDTPRWQELSLALRARWNLKQVKGWDADQLALAQLVFHYPDRVVRQPHDTYQTRICLVDLDRGGAHAGHLNTMDIAVVIGVKHERTLILSHSVVMGFRAHASLEALGDYLGLFSSDVPPGSQLEWRLVEPEGDFFDTQACTLIALQAQALGELDFSNNSRRTVPHRVAQHPHKNDTRFNRIDPLLPEWLAQAHPNDLSAFSRHLMDLAEIREGSTTSFEQEIPPIQRFALDHISLQMQKKHPEAKQLKLADLRIHIVSPVVWGTQATGGSETLILSLAELALENLIAVPLGDKTLYFLNAEAVPDWLTVAYVEELVTTVNVGKTYPALIKERLIDDPLKSVYLRDLYSRHLQVQLPLLALQNKIRGEGAIDEQGYRYVVAVMSPASEARRVDDQEIVIRPLSFVLDQQDDDRADIVSNMFVIGPRDQSKGPCLLYRPLLDHALTQYPTPASLIYAIKHSKKIRESVLAWLPDQVRATYSNYIFHGDLPYLAIFAELLTNPLLNVNLNKPVRLGSQVLDGDYLPALFNANAYALIDLADRQSVSNAESHWATLKLGAWKLFNAVLPFLDPTFGAAVWIWQLFDDLQQTLEAVQNDDHELAQSALTDLILSLAMVLAHRAATRGKPAQRFSETVPEQSKITGTPLPPAKIHIKQRPDIFTADLPDSHQSGIHSSGALNRTPVSLGQTLERFAIDKPAELGQAIVEGPQQHLYASGEKLYANVGARWFEVQLSNQQDVQIIDTRHQPMRSGPLLVHNRQGRWFIDTRLRLRGGGLKSRKAQVLLQNAQRIEELRGHLKAFNEQLGPTKTALIAARKALTSATEETLKAHEAVFLQKLEAQIRTYDTTLGYLKELNRIDAVPRYRASMIEMLRAQLFFNQSWIDHLEPAFKTSLDLTLTLLADEEMGIKPTDLRPYKEMLRLSTLMIERIEMAQTNFLELGILGKEAAQVASDFRKKLPRFEVQDMRALLVTLTREFCVKDGDGTAVAQARESIERLVDEADLAIQNSLDLQREDNLLGDHQRIEALNTLVDQFTSIDQRLKDLPGQFADVMINEQLELLQRRIDEFGQQSTRQLTQLLRDRGPQQPQPGPSRTPVKKAIKTRFKGTQLAVPRKEAEGHVPLADVKASLTGKVLATFHEKEPGVWVQRLRSKPLKPQSPQSLTSMIGSAQTQLDAVNGFIERQKNQAREPNRLPVEIEESLTHHANQLSETARAIEQALVAAPSSNAQAGAAVQLKQKLDAAVKQLKTEGHQLRVSMTKRQLPTAPRVEWLLGHQEVTIDMIPGRRRLKGPKKDFLEEYEIRERQSNAVLWYAHFHYERADTSAELFSAAHLKTKEQRLLGGSYNLSSAASTQEVIAIYRSEIGVQLAKKLFFSGAPTSSTGARA